jgi:mono/diheme cytochrome c family protein
MFQPFNFAPKSGPLALLLLFLLVPILCQAAEAASPSARAPLAPDWSAGARIPLEGRPNPYGWAPETLEAKIRAGKIHALQYPITATGLLIPARPALKTLNAKPGDALFGLMKRLLSLSSDFEDFEGFWKWLGLHEYPETEGAIPFPKGKRPRYPMGVSLIERNGAKGLTLSCAACHSAELFGKPILGLTNRFPRANLFFIHGQSVLKNLHPALFSVMTGATNAERSMYAESRERIESVGLKRPEALGLDTSLAQVALSLAKRAPGPWAERNAESAARPRATALDGKPVDSKPAPWWNVKYKNRWLSDGSVLSGNPIFTNFLWNEIGRGVDLPELVEWLKSKNSIVEELTTAVFATEAPKWRDYLSESAIDIERARRGEKHYLQSCAGCHGTYVKAWSLPGGGGVPGTALIDTVQVKYSETTRVKDVGTDPFRREGMRALAEGLNPLEFSKSFGIVIEEQKGYVPPPLEGVWARFPYFHNNSIPNLCALMTPPSLRPVRFRMGEVVDRDRDFDQDCVGYPVDRPAPNAWTQSVDLAPDAAERIFDARKPGLSNAGHYFKIFTLPDGSEKYTPEQKRELVEFLKTL